MYLIKCFIKVAVRGKYLLFNLERNFQKLFTNKSTSFNSKFVLKTPAIVKSFFTFKDKFPKMLLSGLVKCGGCNITNYDKKKRYFKVRICEHLGISYLTEKKGEDRQQQGNSKPRTPLMLQLFSIFWMLFYFDQRK